MGIGAGLLFPISLTLASDMQNTERVFSIKLAVEQLVPAVLLVLMALGSVLTALMAGRVAAANALLLSIVPACV